jgi:hypothetical protein
LKRDFVLACGQALTLLENGKQKLVKDKDLTPPPQVTFVRVDENGKKYPWKDN